MPNAKLISAKDLPESVRDAVAKAEAHVSLTAPPSVEAWTIIGRRIDDLDKANQFAKSAAAELALHKIKIDPIVVALPGGGHTAGFFPVANLKIPNL